MNEQAIRWDDLRIVLAITESGSLSGAGRQLGMSHATVFRRLNDMEKRLGVALFVRTRSGYRQTPAGEDLAAAAGRIQQEVLKAERRLVGRDLRLTGSIRVTTTDALFDGVLSGLFAHFREDYPDIELEVVISNQRHSLTKREADVAIRPTNRPPETLIGRHPGNITQALYGLRDHWADQREFSGVEAFRETSWIGPDAHMGDTTLETWLHTQGMNHRIQYRLDSILATQQAVRQGSGIAALPCYLASQDAALQQLTAPIPELSMQLWLLTHSDSRRMARIQTFLKVIGDGMRLALSQTFDAERPDPGA